MSSGLNFLCSNATNDVNKEKDLDVTLEKAYLHHDTDETRKGKALNYKTGPETGTITSRSFEELYISDMLKSTGRSELTMLTETETEYYFSSINTAAKDNYSLASELVVAIRLLEGNGVEKENPSEEGQFSKAEMGQLDEGFCKSNQKEQINEHQFMGTEQVSSLIEKKLSSDNNAKKYLERVPGEDTCNKRDAEWQVPCTESHASNSVVKRETSLRTHIASDCAFSINMLKIF
ncbi:hypothetical protein XELAEV_18008166mg [Xenopus laevis]|uniref:Uncharacterized protein n=1 Tax=Xenopus laevis TaxID=8355 RepID=A0A974E445_XENLA|nr:hypothetical protein XELAEV_18008166mg [Xenopus laevis]